MRKFIIAHQKIENNCKIGDIVRNMVSHEIFIVKSMGNNVIQGSAFGDTNLSDIENIKIGIRPLNKYITNDDITSTTWNPFKKLKDKIDKKKWLEDENYCQTAFIHFNSKEIEIQMIPKIGTIIDGGSPYFYKTFNYILN